MNGCGGMNVKRNVVERCSGGENEWKQEREVILVGLNCYIIDRLFAFASLLWTCMMQHVESRRSGGLTSGTYRQCLAYWLHFNPGETFNRPISGSKISPRHPPPLPLPTLR